MCVCVCVRPFIAALPSHVHVLCVAVRLWQILICFSSFSFSSRLRSLLYLLFHPSLAFFFSFPFIILLLHPSADHLSWEAAGWRWAYVETKLLISTTVCVGETLLTEESNHPR